MIPRIEASINLSALDHNFSLLRKWVGPEVAVMPMVKADAYGHGLVEIAQHLPLADAFGVASVEEALILRQAHITQPIVVMSGFSCVEEIDYFIKFQLTAVIHHAQQVRWLEAVNHADLLSIWLKLDTGMHRLGIGLDEFASTYQRLNQCASVVKPFGVMTHLAASDSDEEVTRQQLALFESYVGHLNCPKSVSNSAGMFCYQQAHYDLVRPGIMLYGVSPFENKSGVTLGLQPVMTLTARLIAYKSINAGARVGYGGIFTATQDLLLGVVGAGYGDGYPRHLDHQACVLVDNVLCPVVGRVSMDMLTIDLSGVRNPSLGAAVTLWGAGLPVEHVAKSADTIAYELFCKLTRRVHRRYVSF